jgi:hypothetical protein
MLSGEATNGLLSIQDGSWKLTPNLCTLLGIEYDVCKGILKDAGINSLGKYLIAYIRFFSIYHVTRAGS